MNSSNVNSLVLGGDIGYLKVFLILKLIFLNSQCASAVPLVLTGVAICG